MVTNRSRSDSAVAQGDDNMATLNHQRVNITHDQNISNHDLFLPQTSINWSINIHEHPQIQKPQSCHSYIKELMYQICELRRPPPIASIVETWQGLCWMFFQVHEPLESPPIPRRCLETSSKPGPWPNWPSTTPRRPRETITAWCFGTWMDYFSIYIYIYT